MHRTHAWCRPSNSRKETRRSKIQVKKGLAQFEAKAEKPNWMQQARLLSKTKEPLFAKPLSLGTERHLPSLFPYFWKFWEAYFHLGFGKGGGRYTHLSMSLNYPNEMLSFGF